MRPSSALPVLSPPAHTKRSRLRLPVRPGRLLLLAVLLWGGLLHPCTLNGESVRVSYKEGLIHGFLVLQTLEGKTLADGDLIQVAHGNRVTNHLVFHFADGSIHDETAVFSQGAVFRLLTDHLVQKGPAFPHPLELSFDALSGRTTVRYVDDAGKEKLATERLDLPSDVANGMVFTLLKNLPREAPQTKVSMVAATPKPRLVKLAITAEGEDTFRIGESSRQATRYVVKVEIGGVSGLLAPLLGKQPEDTHVWILHDDAPAFVKSEGPLYLGGPIWRIELTKPVWPARSENVTGEEHAK
jgi:hypothetical protein